MLPRTKIVEPRNFHFAGIDLILDRSGRWIVLEANDHPLGLIEADTLTQGFGGGAVFDGDGLETLAQILASRTNGKAVCLLLPDCFRVETRTHFAERVRRNSKRVYDDIRLNWTLRSFNALAERVQQLGAACFISDVLGIELHGRTPFLSDSTPVGALFRRAYKFPPIEVDCTCVNDLRLRRLCTDKLKTYEVLRAKLGSEHLPPTYSLLPNKESLSALARYVSEGQMIITKPNTGSASRGVERIRPEQAFDALRSEDGAVVDDRIFQEWIEPASVCNSKGGYYFDVRVYVIGGKAVAGFARRSAAPNAGPARDSPLSWLTTTGPVMPLAQDSRPRSQDAISLTEEQVRELRELSTLVTMILDEASTKLDYAETYEKIPGFTVLAGITDRLEFITLKG